MGGWTDWIPISWWLPDLMSANRKPAWPSDLHTSATSKWVPSVLLVNGMHQLNGLFTQPHGLIMTISAKPNNWHCRRRLSWLSDRSIIALTCPEQVVFLSQFTSTVSWPIWLYAPLTSYPGPIRFISRIENILKCPIIDISMIEFGWHAPAFEVNWACVNSLRCFKTIFLSSALYFLRRFRPTPFIMKNCLFSGSNSRTTSDQTDHQKWKNMKTANTRYPWKAITKSARLDWDGNWSFKAPLLYLAYTSSLCCKCNDTFSSASRYSINHES